MVNYLPFRDLSNRFKMQQIMTGIFSLFLICALCPNTVHASGTYSNPVISGIGPADPAVIFHEGVYYLYPTGDNMSYRVYTSSDLIH